MRVSKQLKKLVPRSFIQLFRKKPLRISAAELEKVRQEPQHEKWRDVLAKTNLKRSFYDEMYSGDGATYLSIGLSALECIEAARKESNVRDVRQILDLPSGHGRVLRLLSPFFPHAETTACDTNKDAVDFCKSVFGAHPVYSKENLREFNLDRKFDLIWCGSLATHFNAEKTKDLLDFFYRHLNPGGLLVFTMHGRFVMNNLATRKQTYLLSDPDIEKVLQETEEKGYGYADYPNTEGYGVSVAKPEWIQATLDSIGKWRNYRFAEKAWADNHDVYSVVKA